MRPRLVRAIAGTIAFAVVLVGGSMVCSQDDSHESGTAKPRHWNEDGRARLASPPLGLPAVPVPADNPVTVEKISLGRKLFFDRRLSANDTMSCAMCHIPEQGFTNNELSIPVGVHGRSLNRNAPTILNVAYVEQLFLDGRASSLEEQAVVPLLHRDEMANPSPDALVARIGGLEDYTGLFEAAFGGGPSLDRIAAAIASWERTLLAADSPFDRWRYGHETSALTLQQQRGFQLFVGKGRCQLCHAVGAEHALLMDQKFHDTGIGSATVRSLVSRTGKCRWSLRPGRRLARIQSLTTVWSGAARRFGALCRDAAAPGQVAFQDANVAECRADRALHA